jgi:predicted ATPase/class 3 adenylate cyclase
MSLTPPTGTITFLFTDIEGSTRLWQAHPEAMTVALRRHDAILRETLSGHNGYIFKTVGDAFCCAFQTARHVVEAALHAQRLLAAEPWPAEIDSLRVRMAVHTGTTDERDGDYFGPALNRVARLLAAGHGGQILLSAVVAALIRDDLPPGVSLIDLGAHRLKDLTEDEAIFQLASADLPAMFPPLRTLDVARHNLPIQTTPLIGRRAQVDAVIDLLRQPGTRLITLTGVGGAGKTRLALQVAAEISDEYEHGVFFVDLTQVTEPDGMAPAIIGALGIAAPSREDPQAVVERYVTTRNMLLLLDNFEQVVRGAPVVSALLRAAPRLEALVTSRELLRISGEHEYAVPPLTMPEPGLALSCADYMRYEAVALFAGRAAAARGDFVLTDDNAQVVAEISARLDGLPLAIELAAARTRLFTPQALLTRLGERLDVLGQGMRDWPERHQTLRGAIDWSYNLLDEGERMLFRRLAVFRGGWGIDAAEAICDDNLPLDVLEGLESLLNKSLIRRVEAKTAEPRFAMLVTISEYAREQLAAGGEEYTLRQRHANYFHKLAVAASGELRAYNQLVWLNRLDLEIENIRAALGFLLDDDPPHGVAMAIALRDYWLYSYKHVEGEAWLRRAVALTDHVDVATQVDAQTALAMVLYYRNKTRETDRLLETIEPAAAQLGDPRRLAWVVMWQAIAKAAIYGTAALPDLRPRMRASAEALRLAGDKPGTALALNIIGEVLRLAGDLDAAEVTYLELIPIAQEIGDFRGVVFQYSNLAAIAYERRDAANMRRYARLSLPLSLRYRAEETAADFLVMVAVLSLWSKRDDVAGRLIGAADRWYEESSVMAQPSGIPTEMRMKNEVRAGLSEELYQRTWEAGRMLSLAEAVALAEEELAVLGEVGSDD